MTGKVGVAISTHRRPEILGRALQQWAQFLPDELVVIHDVHGQGVAWAKNQSIAALMDAGCEHLFLADDDVWPIRNGWAELYMNHPEPHLMHCWGRDRYQGDDLVAGVSTWSWPKGVILYAERRVIDAVGGMRLDFGRWGGEHGEWSIRIHEAGFTTHTFQDVLPAKQGVWTALDYSRGHKSVVPKAERIESSKHHDRLLKQFAGTTDFVDYRACRAFQAR